jgi:hypothetical protein
MSRNHTFAAVLFAFAVGYFLAAQPAKADLGTKCDQLPALSASNKAMAAKAESTINALQAGGRTHGVVISGVLVCAW